MTFIIQSNTHHLIQYDHYHSIQYTLSHSTWHSSFNPIHKKYTQSGGRRPFGISTLIIGYDGLPCLFQTDPSGIYSAWKATAVGRSSKTVSEFLEKNYVIDMDKDQVLKLTVKSLLEVIALYKSIFNITKRLFKVDRRILRLLIWAQRVY